MADQDYDDNHSDRAERDWRGGRDWGAQSPRENLDSPRRFGAGPPTRDENRAFAGSSRDTGRYDDRGGARGRDAGRDRDERPASYEAGPSPYEPGGAAARGYGEGGDSAYGQMASGSSDSGLGGYGGAGGGYGQPNLNSQWGAGGYGPLTQGTDYGQGGGQFGPAGYDTGDFSQHPRGDRKGRRPVHHDEHHASYRTWREARLASHDQDYGRWRDEQVRRYDEDYGSWRNERHTAFSKEFEGWRTGRGGQSGAGQTNATTVAEASGAATTANPSERTHGFSAEPQAGYAHGANPTLARIADGEDGKRHHDHEKAEHQDADKDPSRH